MKKLIFISFLSLAATSAFSQDFVKRISIPSGYDTSSNQKKVSDYIAKDKERGEMVNEFNRVLSSSKVKDLIKTINQKIQDEVQKVSCSDKSQLEKFAINPSAVLRLDFNPSTRYHGNLNYVQVGPHVWIFLEHNSLSNSGFISINEKSSKRISSTVMKVIQGYLSKAKIEIENADRNCETEPNIEGFTEKATNDSDRGSQKDFSDKLLELPVGARAQDA